MTIRQRSPLGERVFVFGGNRFQPYYRLDDQRLLAGEGRVMDQSDSRDWIPTDPVARKKATKSVKLTTGEKFNEGSGEWEHGQWPHVFKVITDKKKGLKPDNEFYWCWECRCGARRGEYGSTKTALAKGDSHSNLANKRESKPIGREAAARDKPPPVAYDRVHDRRDRRS